MFSFLTGGPHSRGSHGGVGALASTGRDAQDNCIHPEHHYLGGRAPVKASVDYILRAANALGFHLHLLLPACPEQSKAKTDCAAFCCYN